MFFEISTDREFRTLGELTALVKAVANSPVRTQETRWAEWKSSLDLETAHGKFTVAKAILGFANLSPETSAEWCEGTAYVVVGAAPGRVDGITFMDHSALMQKIKTYAVGPRWTPHYLPYGGKDILVIVVAPPRHGDHIHTLQTDYDKAQAGTIFHRSAAMVASRGVV